MKAINVILIAAMSILIPSQALAQDWKDSVKTAFGEVELNVQSLMTNTARKSAIALCYELGWMRGNIRIAYLLMGQELGENDNLYKRIDGIAGDATSMSRYCHRGILDRNGLIQEVTTLRQAVLDLKNDL